MPVDDRVKRQVWVQCGGRCVICNDWLLEDHLGNTDAIRAIGEVAHIAAESDDGPRADESLPNPERNSAPNLILLCPNDHTSADKRLTDPQYTVEYLYEVKKRHESFIRYVTDLRDDGRTTVLRIHGDVRGAPAVVTRAQAAQATMNCNRRVPQYLPDPTGQGVEVRLHDLPNPGSTGYWESAARQVQVGLDRVQHGIAQRHIEHISVFAFTYVPLLVLAGNCLDNAIAADVYQRQRHLDSWVWDEAACPFAFEWTEDPPTELRQAEAVLVVNASGTVDTNVLPPDVAALPRFLIRPTGDETPGPHTFNHRLTLVNFGECVASMLAELERPKYRNIRMLHVFAAVPNSAAFVLGRLWPVGNAAPEMLVYHLDNGSYVPALRVPWRDQCNPLTPAINEGAAR